MDGIKLNEIIEGCNNGAYIAGDAFINDLGQELYFDGQRLVGIEKVPLDSTFKYKNTHFGCQPKVSV